VLVSEDTILRFWHQYNTEATFDGGVVEIEVDGGPWIDLGSAIVQGGYNISLFPGGLNPLADRDAFSGYSGGYVETVADLGANYDGSNVRVRFRFGSDSSGAGIDGWRIDDVQIIDEHFISNTACLNTAESYGFCDTIETPVLKDMGQSSTINYPAQSESTIIGSRTGSFPYTQADDDEAEELTEGLTGKKRNQKSLLDHQWTFDVPDGNQVTFVAIAWAPPSPDGDTFQFTYSANGSGWLPLADISVTFDDGSIIMTDMIDVSGLVTIRLTDTDQSRGGVAQDTAYVDYLLIRTEVYSGGNPPIAPTNLIATVVSDSRIDLSWEDLANDEFGYQIERSSDQANWDLIDIISANSTTHVDNSVSGGLTYYYRLSAYNNSGIAAYSNTVDVTTPGSSSISIHIGDLDGQSRYDGKRRWLVEVTITVHDGLDLPVAGTTVFSSWLDGAGDADSCDTGSDGRCIISLTRIPLSVQSVTFQIDDISNQDSTYEPARNHDPDGDSDGFSITIAAQI
jgi:hypothetical protein